jgi:hypothetical protein
MPRFAGVKLLSAPRLGVHDDAPPSNASASDFGL